MFVGFRVVPEDVTEVEALRVVISPAGVRIPARGPAQVGPEVVARVEAPGVPEVKGRLLSCLLGETPSGPERDLRERTNTDDSLEKVCLTPRKVLPPGTPVGPFPDGVAPTLRLVHPELTKPMVDKVSTSVLHRSRG